MQQPEASVTAHVMLVLFLYNGDNIEIYTFKNLNELPSTNLSFTSVILPQAHFSTVKSAIPTNVNWQFEFVDRLERPPSIHIS